MKKNSKVLTSFQMDRVVNGIRITHSKAEEHYLCKCPKCNSDNIAMSKHYTNMGVIGVDAICRECHTHAFAKDRISAMVLWNKGQVTYTH